MHVSRRGFVGGSVLGLAGAATAAASRSVDRKDSADLPTAYECDICVLGGSATGVFAAVRAARLGAKVALVEREGAFGGVATNSLVNVWHSLRDNEFNETIIGGLTVEVMDRLKKRDAVRLSEKNPSYYYAFNSQELKIELDELVLESKVKPYLHTLFSEPFFKDGELAGVIIDNKSGRRVIRAKYFVDATGDADLCFRMGVPCYTYGQLQPPTTCAHLDGFDSREFHELLKKHHEEFGIALGFSWDKDVPGTHSLMLAGTRMYGRDCSNGDDLSLAEIEGRKQIRAIMDMMRKYAKSKPGLTALPAAIGIRDTRHIRSLHQLTDKEAMNGVSFEDTVAKGAYRFDLHHQEKPGLTFWYLDGREEFHPPGQPMVSKRWRSAEGAAKYYQIPLRSIIPQGCRNLIAAGRMLDAEKIAFSGTRVMVNMNQLGEAAGVACAVALQNNTPIGADVPTVLKQLRAGGSLV